MGIGRKATDQRTPCRKFLATPLIHSGLNMARITELVRRRHANI